MQIAVKIFHEGTFAAARLSLDVEESRSIRSGPALILIMFPNPFERTLVFIRNLIISAVVKLKTS